MARPGEDVVGARTLGRHPAVFVYDPRPLWRALGRPVDVIDVHEEPFALATAEILLLRWLRRQRAPYVLYTAQNIDKRYPVPFRWVERAALRGARGVSACNEAAARIAERKGFPGRASTIDLGTDLTSFRPAEPVAGAPAESVGHVGPVVGYAGRLDPAKGVDVLLRAAAIDPALRVRLAGDGPERAALAALADELGVTGTGSSSPGRWPPTALPDFYRSLDALAVPSLTTTSWVEQFGRVALEAMACGTPVVVSDSGALPGVVDGAALVVPEGDPAALAKGLQQATGDPVVRSRLRADGLGRARRSSWDEVATAYEQLYRRASHERVEADRPLEVVVVAYGQPALLARALAPLDGLSVTVVDNSSSPEVRSVVGGTGARYVDPGRNGGFAAGVNEGLRRADPLADVLLVNPDAVIDRSAIETLRTALASDGTTGQRGSCSVRRRRAAVPGRVAVPLAARHLGRRRGSGAASPQRLRHRVGAAAPARGTRPRRALRRRALLPLRRGDGLGLPSHAPRVATPCRRRGPASSTRAPRRAPTTSRRSGPLPRRPRDLPPQAPRPRRVAVEPSRQRRRVGGARRAAPR